MPTQLVLRVTVSKTRHRTNVIQTLLGMRQGSVAHSEEQGQHTGRSALSGLTGDSGVWYIPPSSKEEGLMQGRAKE
ncbi:hypothetical protein LEMLEM_LOCUS9977 [Lemmus lemmus]